MRGWVVSCIVSAGSKNHNLTATRSRVNKNKTVRICPRKPGCRKRIKCLEIVPYESLSERPEQVVCCPNYPELHRNR